MRREVGQRAEKRAKLEEQGVERESGEEIKETTNCEGGDVCDRGEE